MTHTFKFGEHSAELLQYTMSTLKEAGAAVTVATACLTHQKFVLHTVTAVFPEKLNPVKFTRA
jgi:hypothetical protein